jgi:hypothetical protein
MIDRIIQVPRDTTRCLCIAKQFTLTNILLTVYIRTQVLKQQKYEQFDQQTV